MFKIIYHNNIVRVPKLEVHVFSHAGCEMPRLLSVMHDTDDRLYEVYNWSSILWLLHIMCPSQDYLRLTNHFNYHSTLW